MFFPWKRVNSFYCLDSAVIVIEMVDVKKYIQLRSRQKKTKIITKYGQVNRIWHTPRPQCIEKFARAKRDGGREFIHDLVLISGPIPH